MPQVYYLNDYCYEITGLTLTVYKYDIFDNTYYKIDQCYIHKKIPKKYEHVLNDINQYNNNCCDSIISKLSEIQIVS